VVPGFGGDSHPTVMEVENGSTTDDGFQEDIDSDEVEFTPEEPEDDDFDNDDEETF
jgi:hypothetical protein